MLTAVPVIVYIRAMKNKNERINGNLERQAGRWVVRSGYGTFPLVPGLQNKPETEGEVEATVRLGEVVDYHFCLELKA